ncbi:1-phosphofructokinase family hexose kinase [Kitasatospora sp. NPDC051170]|uniref:1-phosphofructokinase family hexose kinase n=1 Tax=Kitasatospora sp. NPDC051170 TaxID=3364056 RepID=UPI003794862D
MILTVTLNAALDVTYEVDRLLPGASHRVERVHERAGGKGINVARVLAALGRPAAVTGLAGGATGSLLRQELHAAGLRDDLVAVAGDSRRTVTVVSRADGEATVFNQPGPRSQPSEWAAFRAHYARLVEEAEVVVLAGSLPPGLPQDAYAQLVTAAARAGATTVVDASGAALLAALAAGPDVVKPNAAELAEATGRPGIEDGVDTLRLLGARAVVLSRGPDGLHAVTPEGRWRSAPPRRLAGNPTGAGDACVAALAAGLADGAGWPELLREATALSAAAVLRPVAGEVDLAAHPRFRATVLVEELKRDEPKETDRAHPDR